MVQFSGSTIVSSPAKPRKQDGAHQILWQAASSAIAARKVVVVFDCCHSGGIGQPKDAATHQLKAGLAAGYYETLAAGHGRVILASLRATEYSYVLPKRLTKL